DVLGTLSPSVRGALPTQPLVGRMMVLALDESPESGVDRIEAFEIIFREMLEELHAYCAKKAFDFPLSLRLIRASVDEGDTQPGAHQSEVLRAIHGPVIDVQALGSTAADNTPLEYRQKGAGLLVEREGGVRDQTSGVVEQPEQIGFALAFGIADDRRPVHHVAHPKLARHLETETTPILRLGAGLRHQSVATEQPMHRRRGQNDLGRDLAAGSGTLDDLLDAQLSPVVLDHQE